MIAVFLFVFGLFLGSFVGVLADRLPRGESILLGRSHCTHCKKILRPVDLIPLLSYLFLRARCRYCKEHLSLVYPIVEIATGLMLAILWLSVHSPLFFVFDSIVFLSFLALFIADMQTFILPDELLVVGFVGSLGLKILGYGGNAFVSGITGIAVALFFMAIILFTRGRGMGFGDVKLGALIGFFLGFPLGLVAVYIAFLTGGFVGAILLISGKKRIGQIVPFGPFLIIGAIISFFFAREITVLLLQVF